ncbi:MAG: HDIG domain-containing protein [Candidatus Blackburnbacteria bacterium]|nr:HDIG domain-containing protein [Candidatus Blackburnbacteria bacterium]
MNKKVIDWDFTTNATPEEILKLFPEGFYDNQFGTVGIAHESSPKPYEITTFRREIGYSDKRRPDRVEWGKTLEEDLARRDFTINAMALKVYGLPTTNYRKTVDGRLLTIDCNLIDPFGGQEDLRKKIIKAVGDPVARFNEDALRMMRAVRIAAELGFTIEHETFEAIKRHAESIKIIAAERIRDELFKILKSDYPYEGIIIMRNCGLSEQVMPEFEETFGVEQKSPERHHIYDVGTHSLLALKNCPSKNPLVRFSTLIHDIGKPKTQKVTEGGVITFYNHEVVGAGIAKRIADRLRFSNKERGKLFRLVRWHQFTVDERQTDSAIKRFIRNVGTENVQDMLDLRVGDRLGGGARETSWRLEKFKKRLEEVQKQPFSIKDLKVGGNDVMHILGIKPGPKVGEVLEQLFKEVEENPSKNTREHLLQRIKEC